MAPPAAPTSTKEQLGAALQTAGQYAGGSTVWTPQNAEELGLDPSRGYIAKGTPTDQPQPARPQQPGPQPSPHPTPEPTPPPPSDVYRRPIGQGILEDLGKTEIFPGFPLFPPTRQEYPFGSGLPTQQPKEQPPRVIGELPAQAKDEQPKEPPRVIGELPKDAIPAPAVQPNRVIGELPSDAVPAPPAVQPAVPSPVPTPVPQPPTPMPSGTGEGAPQGVSAPLVPGRDAHVSALIASGKTPGEAQAIADGQQPKTLNGQAPQPKPKQPPDIGTIAGEQAYVTGAPVSGILPAEATKPTTQPPSGDLHTQAEHKLFEADPATLSPSQREAQANLIAHWADADKQQAPSEPSTTTTTTEEPPKVVEGNRIQGTSTIFGLNYDQSIDPDDNGRGFFGGVNTRNPKLKAVAVPVDVLEKVFGHFAELNAQGGYDMVDTPEAKAVVKAIQSAHVEVPDDNGKIHKFPIVDIQGSLKGHPGKVLDMTYGATKEMGFADNHAISYQIIGGDGKPYPIPDNIEFAGAGGGKGGGGGVSGGGLAGQPLFSVPTAGGSSRGTEAGPPQRAGGWSGDGGGGGGARGAGAPAAQTTAGLDVVSIPIGNLFGRSGGGPSQAPAQEEPQPPPGKPANVLGVQTISPGPPPPAPSSLQAQLLPPPAAPGLPSTSAAAQAAMPPPSAAPKGPDPAVVKALMKRGFTRQQAEAFAAKATVSKPGAAAITGGASKPAPQPSGAPPAKQAPPAPAAPAAASPAKQIPASPQPQPREATRIGPEGSTIGVPNPPGGPSPDDPRVKKQKDNLTKGEHFVPGDDFHDQLLNGLPNGQGGRQRQILGQAEQTISDRSPLHISYISAPKEAAKFPTRESRTVQYDAHSPEARLMGTTEGQLVGHSLIPTAVGISPSRKANEPNQGYIQGLSTNVMANNFQHILTKLAAMDRKSPYTEMGRKFSNDLEGYLANLNAGHTGTGRGYAVGTEQYPTTPDESHVPYKLTRGEADFLNLVINNTGAFAKHEDGQALRELARANGTLINERGETNRLRHQIEEHEPGWRERVLEPTIRSFKAGLVHEIHPTEEHMPESIRPGKEYHDLTAATARTSQRGRPDVPVAASLHHTFTDNKRINQIERDFSDERINEAEARSRLKALGEDPDEYQFVGGSGGLITPYEENPEAITPEEHTELKTNLRKQWIGGKMPIEDYRRKAAEVPLPEKPSQPPAASPAAPETETVPSPKPITPVKPKPPKPQPEPEPEHAEAQETPEAPAPAKPVAPTSKPKEVSKAPQGPPEAPTEERVEPKRPPEVPSASHYVSPNVKEGTDLAGALKQVQSQPHKKARDFYQRVEDAYRPEGGGTVTPTVGNWEGTAEGSSWTHDDKDSLQDARTKAALKGLHSAQKGTAAFHYDEAGPDRHYDIDFPEHSHEEADKLIAKHGFPASTIHKTPEGLRAHLIDPGGENYEHALQLAAEAKAKSPIARRGTAAFDGGDDRPAAAEAYRRILGESGIQIRGSQGGISLRGHPSQGRHPLQPLYEEAEDNYQRLARELGQKGEAAAPGETVGSPPAPGDILPPAKPKKAAKTKEQSGLEAQDFEQAAADRDNISPEDAGRLTRIQKIAKTWVKKNPNLHDLSMHSYLTGQKQFPGKLTKEGIGEHFDATNPKLDYSKEEHRQQASDAVVHDIMHSLAGTTTGKPSTAYGWYDRTVRKTMAKVGEIAPEILTDPDHAMAFKLALAITSQGQDVFPNAESAWHIYQHWLKHGEMPTERKVFGGGIKAEQMEQNLAKVNDLWNTHGTEGLHKILMSRMTSRELREKYGLDSGEKAAYEVNGAMGLGPKIGAFFSNLNGDFDPTTIDLWFSRNMNLMAGNMFGFSDKATRQDRMEKGELVKSHLSELKELLDSGMVSVPRARAAKMSKELGKLQRVPQGKLDRPRARALAPEIYDWAREQHRTYQKSAGYERSYHPDLRTKDNVTAKKLDESVTGLSDDPRTTTERDHWRDIMARADQSLKGAKVHLTNADKQALLWFNIKDLFKMAGSPQRPKADYLDAAHRLVRKVKSGELPGLQQAKQPSGGVLKMQGGGLVPFPSMMTLGATDQQPSSPLLGQTTAPRATPIDTTPAPRAELAPAPAAPAGGFSSMAFTGGQPTIPPVTPFTGKYSHVDINGPDHATLRYNNPSAQWEGPSSRKFGASTYGILKDGNHIAAFEDPLHGAAAQFDLLGSENYVNKTAFDLVNKWSAGKGGTPNVMSYVKSLGLDPNTVITPEMLRSPAGIGLAKAQAHFEAGLPQSEEYPLSDEGWQKAQQMAYGDSQ